MIFHSFAQPLKNHWKKAVASLVVATLLLPLPAFASGFLGNWGVGQHQTGSAPPASITSSFNGSTVGDTLSINTGTYFTPASSTVIATNFYWVDNPGELLTITDGFQAKLYNSTLKYDVVITPISGTGGALHTPPVNDKARQRPVSVNYNNSFTYALGSGLYMVTVKIKSENKNRFSVTKDASPFTISFTGI